MKFIYTITLLSLCFITTAQSLLKGAEKLLSQQERHKIDSLKSIDWLAQSYHYLDADFKISITDKNFQKGLLEGKFIKERITTYRDSLSVVLFMNLKDSDASRIAALRINYTWERLGWNLLMTPAQTKKLAQELNVSWPYRVKEYVEEQTIQEPKRLELLDELRQKVAQLEQVTENVEDLTLKELFNRSFRYSPARLEKVKKIHANRTNSKG